MARVVYVLGDDISTDVIYPGRYSLVNGRVDGGIYRAKLEIELD